MTKHEDKRLQKAASSLQRMQKLIRPYTPEQDTVLEPKSGEWRIAQDYKVEPDKNRLKHASES